MEIDSNEKGIEEPSGIEKINKLMVVDNDEDKSLLNQDVWRPVSKSKKELEKRRKILLEKKVYNSISFVLCSNTGKYETKFSNGVTSYISYFFVGFTH